jgi:hypothetical protein
LAIIQIPAHPGSPGHVEIGQNLISCLFSRSVFGEDPIILEGSLELEFWWCFPKPAFHGGPMIHCHRAEQVDKDPGREEEGQVEVDFS